MKSFISKFLDKTFLKFVLVGIINTLFGTAIMFVFYNVFKLNYWISSASNYIFGSILSYFLNKYFTFQYRESSFKSILKFAVNITYCYILAYGIAKPLTIKLISSFSTVFQDNIAMMVGMCLFVAFNYLGQRFFVFKKQADN